MTFFLPIAITTVLTVAAVLAGLTIIAYILKMRRRRFEVPFSTLWHRVLREKEATSLWKHLRRFLSLLLALAMLALFGCSNPAEDKPEAEVGEAKAVDSKASGGETLPISQENSSISFVGSKVVGSHDGGFNAFVGETNDAWVNDMWADPVGRDDVFEALSTASDGPVAEGSGGAPGPQAGATSCTPSGSGMPAWQPPHPMARAKASV